MDIENIHIKNPQKWHDASRQLWIASGCCFALAVVMVVVGWDFRAAGVLQHVLSPSELGTDSVQVNHRSFSTLGQQQHRVRWAFSLLWAILVGMSFSIGAMFFILMQHLSRAGWSVVVRRLAEQVMRTLPFLFLLLWGWVMLGGISSVYHWVHPDDPILAKKVAYLNVPFFLIRLVGYCIVWTLFTRFFSSHSFAQDVDKNPGHTVVQQRFSGPWTFGYAVTVTFFAFDVLMSIDPHWYSTIFGIYFFVGCVVAFLSLLGIMVVALQAGGYLQNIVTTEHLHDVTKLLFGFNAFWAYIAYSQYGIIWYGNIPEETLWFLERMDDPFWLVVSRVLVVGHLIIPFFVLISKHAKRNKMIAVSMYVWLIGMHALDLYYLVMPRSTHVGDSLGGHHLFAPQWLDVVLLIAVLTFFAGWLVRFLANHPLIPQSDPRLQESLEFHNL